MEESSVSMRTGTCRIPVQLLYFLYPHYLIGFVLFIYIDLPTVGKGAEKSYQM